jgi:cytochrome P450
MANPPPQIDYDPYTPPTLKALREEWAKRREQCPVSYSDTYDGFVYLTRYEDVAAALVDTATFSSAQGVSIPKMPFQFLPEELDPPEQRKYRHLINPRLAPQVVKEHEAWIREICTELLNAIDTSTEFDVIDVYTRPLPQRVTIKLVGIPEEDLDIVARTTTLLTTRPREDEEAQAASLELFGYLAQLLQTRRQAPLQDDFISDLMDATVDGQPVTDEQILSFIALLLFGGLHTTAGAIAGALLWLADHQDMVPQFLAGLGVDDKVLNEALRYTGPSAYLGRTVTRDVEVGGCLIHKGQTVMVGTGSANHDPRKFDRPDEIVLDRGTNNHLGFGLGPHRCVGSHLAKVQMRVALQEFLKRYPKFRVGDRDKIEISGGEIRTLCALPLVVEP